MLATRLATAGQDSGSVAPSAEGPAHKSSDPIHHTKSRVVRIEAKPEPIEIDTARTAVIVCDMQNDFGTKGGMFDRAGIDISGIQKAVGPRSNHDASLLAVEVLLGWVSGSDQFIKALQV